LGNGGTVPPQTELSGSPASLQAAARVDLLGRKIIAANPQTGLKPLFLTIGAPKAEVFHRGTGEVVITEGLVNQCQTEGELAAVLCLELGKMVSEREAVAQPQMKKPEPPMEVRVGNDNAGSFGPADQTHMAELAKYDQERRRPNGAPPLPPDPRRLARIYLSKAKFPENALDHAAPLLDQAAANNAFQKQLTTSPPS
jgi:hypothetical protein